MKSQNLTPEQYRRSNRTMYIILILSYVAFMGIEYSNMTKGASAPGGGVRCAVYAVLVLLLGNGESKNSYGNHGMQLFNCISVGSIRKRSRGFGVSVSYFDWFYGLSEFQSGNVRLWIHIFDLCY